MLLFLLDLDHQGQLHILSFEAAGTQNSVQFIHRNALQILERVLSVPEDKRIEVAQQSAAEQSQSIELCRALLNKKPWGEVNKILVGLKDQEAESIRRVVLGYCQSVLLKSDMVRAGRVLEEFLTPFYDSGFPQLVYACYAVTKN